MVHSIAMHGEDECRIQPIGQREYFPSAFRWVSDAHQFLPFEYSDTPIPIPDATFLSTFSNFLLQHELYEKLGLTHLSSREQF